MTHLRHKWYLIQSQHMTRQLINQKQLPAENGNPFTLILYVCTSPMCAKHKCETLQGWWTLSELRGENA